MSTLASFFHGADTHFGTFYPTHYLLAAYPSFEDAQHARGQLIASGFKVDDVIAVPGEDMLRLSAEHVIKDGLRGLLMRKLSRVFGTEVIYTDHDLKLAEHGAGFLAVHCRHDRAKERAWSRLESSEPWVARYYTPGGIDHLAGET